MFKLLISTLLVTSVAHADLFPIEFIEEGNYCNKVITPQKKSGSTCPLPPKDKRGKSCYPAPPLDIDNHHTAGYADYVRGLINNAVAKTQVFKRDGVDITVMTSVINKESWFNPVTTNRWKDRGIAQFQLGTAQATLEYMRALGMKVPQRANEKLPPNCSTTNYNTPLSKACFESIKTNCEKEPYSSSLYCPNFALQLMAFHFLQIKERQVFVEHSGKEYNVSLLLTPPTNMEAELRHLTSVYNRGFRIYNSAYHQFLRTNKWPTAKEYGPLWSTIRPIPSSRDPYPGGNLYQEWINRCYVWAITGICGGIENSTVAAFTKLMCPMVPEEEDPMQSDSMVSYSEGSFSDSMSSLLREFSGKAPYPIETLRTKVKLAQSLYEGDANVSLRGLLQVLNTADTMSTTDEFRALRRAYTQYKYKSTFNEIIERLNTLLKMPAGESYELTQERYAGLQALRAYAKRQHKLADNMKSQRYWLYAAGISGFYLHNSGYKELKQYLKLCPVNTQMGACRYRDNAIRMQKMSLMLSEGKGAREE